MEKHLLSKSTFIRGLQCEKSLYLYKNFIQLRDQPSPERAAIFSRGNAVGILARELFPGGVDATPPKKNDYASAVQRTRQLMEEGVEVIYEPAFQYKQVLAILDILVRKSDGWYAYEVKSSVRISQTYILDASLQYRVITGSGTELRDFSLVTVNSQYVRHGRVEVDKLFHFTSVKTDVERNQDMVEKNIVSSLAVVAATSMPVKSIGEHCFSPYSCDFMSTCWKHIPDNSVFHITGISRAEQFSLYNAGVHTIDQIPVTNALDKNVNLHIESLKSGELIVLKEKLKVFVEKIKYPLSYLDFEIFMPAIPLYEGTRPYQHIPFQYSLHTEQEEGAPVAHSEFLAEHGHDPRRAFIESLLREIPASGSILVYDALLERNVLSALKSDFPSYAVEIDSILARIVDLMLPFQEKLYYHPAMKNSFSMKNVLPALEPGMNYSQLSISSGSIAMIAYEQLQNETDMFRIPEVREQLLEYCKMDTYAMTRIFGVIRKAVAV